MPQRVEPGRLPRSGRTYVAVVVYLLCFVVLLIVISNMYLLPAMEASRNASPQEKKQLAAYARLILTVVLFVLFGGLLIAFRIGRFFIPRPLAGHKKTEYVDAWAESGRRMATPPERE